MNLSARLGGGFARPRINYTSLRWCAVAAMAFMIAGCAVGPDYSKPVTDIPASFKEGVEWQRANVDPQASLSSTWWLEYHDDTLTSLIERAQKA